MQRGGSGTYWNSATYSWEAWAVNNKTGEERLLGTLPDEVNQLSPDAKEMWERDVWRDFFVELGVNFS